MNLLRCKEPILLERAGMRVDKEKGGTDRRIMTATLRVPIPRSGMFEDLPEIFSRLAEDARDNDNFIQAKVDFDLTSQRVSCYGTAQLKNIFAVIEFADMKDFRVCRDEKTGDLSLALKVVFDYTNANSQAAAWVPTWIGRSLWWTSEAIQQELDTKAAEKIGADAEDPESESYLPKPMKAGRRRG